MSTATDPISEIINRLPSARRAGSGWSAKCPAHDDGQASLSVTEGEGRKVLLHCHAGCEPGMIVSALGLSMRDLFPKQSNDRWMPKPTKNQASAKNDKPKKVYPTIEKAAQSAIRVLKGTGANYYEYPERDGQQLVVVRVAVMKDGVPDKEIRPFHKVDGGYSWGEPANPPPLYGSDRLAAHGPVYVVEGEKCVNAARAIGINAVGSAFGANCAHKSDWTALAGRQVIIIPDADAAGDAYAADVAQILGRLEPPASVTRRRLPVPVGADAVPKGWDVADFIPDDNTKTPAELKAIIEGLPDEPIDVTAADADGEPTGPNIVEREQPLRLAEHYLAAEQTDDEGRPLLRRYRKEWWVFVRGRGGWMRLEDEHFTAGLYQHLDRLWVPVRDKDGSPTGELTKVVPRSSMVREVLLALPACGILATGDMPMWLDGRAGPDPVDVVAFKNGLLDTAAWRTGDGELVPSTPMWFSGVACPYDYRADAICPEWTTFLNRVFNGDRECIDLLQEWFGYCLVNDNRYEKFMMLVGRPRSGKGTTIAALTAMLGDEQVAVTSFAKLASRFGLHPLLGKLAAILPDAHVSRGTDDKGALEVIKSITGGDEQAIDQKNKDELPKVALRARFTIAVNELPQLPDESGALKPRLLLLHYPNTYAGQEDTGLKERIKREAAGIAAWALVGLARLREAGGFTIPTASQSVTREFEKTVSPVLAFVDDECALSPQRWIEKQSLYNNWVHWCRARGDEPGNAALFGQKLLNAVPTVRATRKTNDHGVQVRAYEGIGIAA